MSSDILPELRPYLECLLTEALAHAGMIIENEEMRERLLCKLHEQLETFIFSRINATLSPSEREQFSFLLEQGRSDEVLQDFATCHIPNIPKFVQRIFVDFREKYLNLGEESEQ